MNILSVFTGKLKDNIVDLDRLKLSNTRKELKYAMESLNLLVKNFDKKICNEEWVLCKPNQVHGGKECKEMATQTERPSGTQVTLKVLI